MGENQATYRVSKNQGKGEMIDQLHLIKKQAEIISRKGTTTSILIGRDAAWREGERKSDGIINGQVRRGPGAAGPPKKIGGVEDWGRRDLGSSLSLC